jgi:hypothetical protein
MQQKFFRVENRWNLPVWSKNSPSLAVAKILKSFNANEFIEGTGENTEEKEYIVTTTRDRSHAKVKIFCSFY